MITPVVLSGGSGTRLWPLSRTLYPKQFLPLNSELSMFQETLARIKGLAATEPLVICNEEHRFLAAEQLRQLDQQGTILLEPMGRNTAPAIALAALQLCKDGQGNAQMLVLAADHLIEDVPVFQQSVEAAVPFAEAGKLVTFGIVPTEPATGYGYIRGGNDLLGGCKGGGARPVAEFVEKPDLNTARDYVKSGLYFWNSGMFMFRADRYLEELAIHRPDILAACEASITGATRDLDFLRVSANAFADCPEDSVDYAVMEKTREAVVIPMDAGWSDVGSWSALWDIKSKDGQGNVSEGDVIALDTQNSFLMGQDRLVATLGVDDLVVIDTKDALLVAAKERVQDVKLLVEQLKAEQRSVTLHHRECYRPWGRYESIDRGERFQAKRISVDPGAKLSLQKHHHRAEHWVVVKGTAQVTRGEETFLVSENQSTYIPIGETHSLENPGKIALELIEVQSGSYLGEDDIVRLEDNYGRADD